MPENCRKLGIKLHIPLPVRPGPNLADRKICPQIAPRKVKKDSENENVCNIFVTFPSFGGRAGVGTLSNFFPLFLRTQRIVKGFGDSKTLRIWAPSCFECRRVDWLRRPKNESSRSEQRLVMCHALSLVAPKYQRYVAGGIAKHHYKYSF